ncbi:MAG TPA: trypsin-like peptidase domain-containing protein [Caldimonas sp.]
MLKAVRMLWREGTVLCLTAVLGSGGAALAALPAGTPDFAGAVSREESVVVSIATVTLDRPRILGLDDEEPSRSLPEEVLQAPIATYARPPRRGLASGFIISGDGAILTSAHAVSGIQDITVRLADGREFVARVVGLDTQSDIAVLRIEAEGLPTALIGDPRSLAVGDWVSAIGAPFGLEASVTAGIVSAKRLLPGTGGLLFLQTDVALNPGSSGSPLFNLRGEVVGINSMLYTTSGGYMGVSFALSIDTAMRIASSLIAEGRVTRGRLALWVQELTPGLAQAFGRSQPNGAIVIRIQRGSVAEAAGMRVGDLIVGLGDRADMNYSDIQQKVADSPPGTKLPLLVWRGGALHRVIVDVTASVDASSQPLPALEKGDRLGLVLDDTPRSPPLVSDAGVEIKEAHGMALRAGISPGDRILNVNALPIRQVADYQSALGGLAPDAYVALLVLRDGRVRYFALGGPRGARSSP